MNYFYNARNRIDLKNSNFNGLCYQNVRVGE